MNDAGGIFRGGTGRNFSSVIPAPDQVRGFKAVIPDSIRDPWIADQVRNDNHGAVSHGIWERLVTSC